VSTTDAAGIEALLKKLEKRYKNAEPSAPEDAQDPVEHLLWSALLWDATPPKAREAYKRLIDAASDLNELRVMIHDEVVALLGPRYPHVDERAARIRMVLNDVYNREHAVSLEALARAPKREARKYLDELDGATTFISARTMAVGLGGHAIPVDETLRRRLIEEDLLDENADCATAAGSLERVIKASDGLKAIALFEAWTADESVARKPASGAKKTAKTSRKKTQRKTSKKAASRKKPAKGRKSD
jgi:endonuclease III